jgi:hypothetical protein
MELGDSLRQTGAPDFQRKIAEAEIEQLPVGHAVQSGPHEDILRAEPRAFR